MNLICGASGPQHSPSHTNPSALASIKRRNDRTWKMTDLKNLGAFAKRLIIYVRPTPWFLSLLLFVSCSLASIPRVYDAIISLDMSYDHYWIHYDIASSVCIQINTWTFIVSASDAHCVMCV